MARHLPPDTPLVRMFVGPDRFEHIAGLDLNRVSDDL